jgi:hypothetical protein
MASLIVGVFLVLVTGSAASVDSGASTPASFARTNLPAGISFRLPVGLHLLHGWLSDVVDPAPRLAVASFDARLSRHTCECGMPNVRAFPRTGAFLFVWEYLHVPRRALDKYPRRAARFRITSQTSRRHTCLGPSDTFTFRDAGRVFQVEIYLGPAARAGTLARLLSVLDSLRVTRAPRRP